MAVIKLFIHQLLFDGFIISGHSFWFLFNSGIFFSLLLFVAGCLFHRKIKRVSDLIFFTLPSFCLLVVVAFACNQLVPFTRASALILTLVLLAVCGAFFTHGHGFAFWKKTFYRRNDIVTLGKYFVVFLLLIIVSNLNIFQNKLPYTANAYDYTNHNTFILDFQRQSIMSQHGGLQLLSYPVGIHSFIAYLDAIMVVRFITPWELAGYFVALFFVGLLAYFRRYRRSLWVAIPLLLCPTLTFLFYEDHINAFAGLIPLFLLFEFVAINFKVKLSSFSRRHWCYLLLINTSLFFIYNYTFFLALPLILGYLFERLIADQKIVNWCKRYWLVVAGMVLALSVGGFLILPRVIDFAKSIYQVSMGQDALEKRDYSLLNFGGISHYRIHDGIQPLEIPAFQLGAIVFWIMIIGGCILRYRSDTLVQKKLHIFTLITALYFFTGVNLLIPSSYIITRTYAYVFVLLFVYVVHLHPSSFRRWWHLLLFSVATLTTAGFVVFYWGDMTRNINFRTLDARVDRDDAQRLQELMPVDSVVTSSHNIHLSHILRFFLFDHSHWLINPNLSGDISEYDLSESDYLVAHHRPYYDNYPREFLTPIYDNRGKDYVVFQVQNYHSPLPLPLTYQSNFNQGVFDQVSWDETIVLLGFYNQEKLPCFFYGRGSEIKNYIQEEINRSDTNEFPLTYFYTYPSDVYGEQYYNYCENTIKVQQEYI